MTIVNLDTLDNNNLKLGKSGRAVKLLYNKEPIQICSSTLYTPFGVKSLNKEWSNYAEYNLDCSLNQSNSETSILFRNSIEKLDKIIEELVRENTSLFDSKNGTCNDDFVYSPLLRENGSYPKLMRLQLSRDKNGNFESFIFDENKQKIKITENNIDTILSKGKCFKTIIECVKVWYYNGKVGSIWKIVQLKLSERSLPKKEDSEKEDEGSSSTKNVYNQLMIMDD
jgi:hypothetical protein